MQTSPDLAMSFNEALGFVVNQHLFAAHATRAQLGSVLGVSRTVAGKKVHGQIGWTAEDVVALAEMFGVSSDDLLPRRAADGGWEPAAYVAGRGARVEGAQAAPAAVPPVGLEPTTFGLKEPARATTPT